MAITSYTGLPGSGKSYSVVENVILPALRAGNIVWTNIPMNTELVENEFGPLLKQFNINDLIENDAWFQEVFTPGATIVIDECWRLWPAGTRANRMEESHKSFLAEHRHMVGEDGRSTEICLVTQDLGQIASYPRSLVASTYRTVKLDMIGSSKRFRVDVYEGAVTGNKPPVSQRLRQIPGKYQEQVYKYYTSQTMSEAKGHGDETRTDDRMNILKSKWIRVGFPVLAALCIYIVIKGLSALSDFYGTDDTPPPGPEIPVVQASQAKPAPPKVRHFFDGMNVYISFNMGTHPRNTVYRIAFQGDAGITTLGSGELYRLGYEIQPIDSCLVRLVGHGGERLVMCPPDDQGKRESIFNI